MSAVSDKDAAPTGNGDFTDITFFVPGRPAPQGSKTLTRGGMRESSRLLKPWRQTVARVAWESMVEYTVNTDGADTPFPLTGPLALDVTFVLPKGRANRKVRPCQDPDADKLARAVCDALQKPRTQKEELERASLVYDDNLFTALRVDKVFRDTSVPCIAEMGAWIRVRVLPEVGAGVPGWVTQSI